jgi:hypothetical protein
MSKKDEIIEEIENELSDIEMSSDYIRDPFRDLKKINKLEKHIPTETVNDQMKADFILENWDKITLEQLEGLVK